MNKTKLLSVLAAGFLLTAVGGCVSSKELNSRITPLEERISKLEQAQKAGTPALDAAVKKADEAAARAEAAEKKAEDAAIKAESAEKTAMEAEKKAETAEKKSAKEFELMQKK